LLQKLFVSIVAQNRSNNYQFFPNFQFGFIINARFCSELTQTKPRFAPPIILDVYLDFSYTDCQAVEGRSKIDTVAINHCISVTCCLDDVNV